MEVVSPLSLLEVTMGEENNAEDDCIIIDDDDSQSNVTRMEVEVDPLLVGPTVVYNDTQNDMPTLWVTTNITNLAGITNAEAAFRKSQYSNSYEVLTEILHCSICLEHVGCDIRLHPSSIEHPALKVLICEHCVCMYKTVNFIMNDKGKEINCRWCGKPPLSTGPVMRTCQQCPFSFCELCLQNNCPDYFECEPRFPWTCVVCNMRVLWPARATLWALHCLKRILLSDPGSSLARINGDISLCCKYRKKKKKVVVDALQNIGTAENLDLDQLVPMHLLNGAPEFPEVPLPDSIKPYRNSQKLNVAKPRAKPRPKSKMKPKPKPKSKPKPKTNAGVCPSSVSAIVSSEENNKTVITPPSDNKKPHWLRQKLVGYINDFDQLKIKLENIEKSLDSEENDAQIEETVGDVTTLLSLHRELLNSCRLSLINEWKERKARLVLEKYNPNTDEVTETRNATSPPKVIIERVQKPKVSKSNNRKRPNSKASISNIKYVNFEDATYHPIKECYVKLQKLEIPLDSFIKQGKTNIK
ncbi:uncharacterized protein [Halyomorpha halys]|uniref:uncharacterized protein n=1 Tax=Halyomorpha halys TaxID=286706 RepID=UPI0006D4E168|nr:uncharacterized protein LOC106690507 [Halyomorpha halys]XP_014291433.1 uncharacterized protein LOC106690507 [Halyomorpha halys]